MVDADVSMAFLLHVAHYRRQSTCLFRMLLVIACADWLVRLRLAFAILDKSAMNSLIHRHLDHVDNRSAVIQGIKSPIHNSQAGNGSGSGPFNFIGRLGSYTITQHDHSAKPTRLLSFKLHPSTPSAKAGNFDAVATCLSRLLNQTRYCPSES
jgi:hypothetical protein